MNRYIVVTLATGALLSVSACNKPPPTYAPAPSPDPIVPTNPPPVEAEPLPTWEEVASGHPENATNPPTPQLVVTPEGDCYKRWVGMMGDPIGPDWDRVQECASDCGTQIQCPPKAAELLEAYRNGTKLQPK